MLSPYIIALTVAWVVAQGAKILIASIRDNGSLNRRLLYSSGNMPSAHAAAAVALVVVIGMRDGFDNAIFGLAVLFAAIVMYDAVMVRRSSGEQGAAIQAIIKETKSKVNLPRAAKGHQPIEVFVGGVIGVGVGLLVYLLT